MIQLTLEQQNAVAQQAETPPAVFDPNTNTRYVLIREDVYERARGLFNLDDSQYVSQLTPHVMEVFGRAGWDDPAMDIYNDLDPRVQP
jgi:hypothetical protein